MKREKRRVLNFWARYTPLFCRSRVRRPRLSDAAAANQSQSRLGLGCDWVQVSHPAAPGFRVCVCVMTPLVGVSGCDAVDKDDSDTLLTLEAGAR